MNDANQWRIFSGDRSQHGDIKRLPLPPKWRDFAQNATEQKDGKAEPTKAQTKAVQEANLKKQQESRWKEFQSKIEEIEKKIDPKVITRNKQRGKNFKIQERKTSSKKNDGKAEIEDPIALVIDAVNSALYLRRPLLITGNPGSGKTSLAYAVAYQLQLGPVLYWPITARSTLQEGLYRYDAIARLQDTQFKSAQQQASLFNQAMLAREQGEKIPLIVQENDRDIGRYIELGPLGTAFLPYAFPRVLLIDEIDKSDINLPNDLLHLFEEGRFKIPELVRMARKDGDNQNPSQETSSQSDEIAVGTCEGMRVPIDRGEVRCDAFPFILMTSNGERDFPPAFLRRCVRVNMPDPEKDALLTMVQSQLGADVEKYKGVDALVDRFLELRKKSGALANDQLLNIVYVMINAYSTDSESWSKERLESLLFKALTSEQDNQ